MSGQRPRRPARRVGGTRGRRAPARGGLVVVVAVVVVAVLVFAGLVYFGQDRAQPAATRVAAEHGNVLGDVNAPVTVEEWGDFQ
ncbi:MAG TPA: hypothetical protein VFW96_10490 [Thermomicrobiales bacterium]|nr:hypothetical protein [Thermomicrobiales bacterium]